tara:strand:+ start:699 stop:947 length:249 start_codon:yes stop_codon:yes gene_type:complete
MFPASFIPRLIKMLAPKLIEPIATNIAKMFKLEKLLRYMELPNDADKVGEKNTDQINMLAGEMSMLEDRIKKIEILSGKDGK